MPKRRSVRKYPCDEVQGEGSYVVLSGVKVKEIRAARKISEEEGLDDFEAGISLLARHVVKWNWVDDEGNELPLPKNDPDVINELTSQEADLLVKFLMGESETKN